MPNEVHKATTTAIENALAFAIEKTSLSSKEAFKDARMRSDCSICEYFRYGLAKELAVFLGATDKKAKAIYVFDTLEPSYTWDSKVADKPSFSSGIHMIIWTERKSPALTSIIDSLSRAVAKESAKLACPKSNALCHQIDIAVVDDQEVQKRTGYGALLDSLFVRPMAVWKRAIEVAH